MTIGRIGGPMLKENLTRQGVDLSFETSLLYLDVNNMRVGVNNATPATAFDLTGTARFSNALQITGSNISTYANNANIDLNLHGTGRLRVSYLTANRVPYVSTNGTVIDNANLVFDGTQLSVPTLSAANVSVSNIASSTGNVSINGNVVIASSTANQVFYASANKSLLTSPNLTFNGTTLDVLVALQAGNINISSNTISSTTVNGNINLLPNGTGNVILSGLTANRVMYLGPNKEVLTSSNVTFDGSMLTVASVTQLGNIQISNNSLVSTNTNGNIDIDPSGSGQVRILGSNAVSIPVGDTSQRPAGSIGQVRINSELAVIEFYDGVSWRTLSGDSSQLSGNDVFEGNGTTTAFTLSLAGTSLSTFVAINGVLQKPFTDYTVSGNTLTFTEAPIAGDVVDVRSMPTTSIYTGTVPSGLSSRVVITGSTSTLANNASQNLTLTGFKTYALMSIQSDTSAWVRIYSDAASRTADESRAINQAPTSNSGLIAESVTTGNQTIKMTPFVVGGNLDSPANTNVYVRVTNVSGSSAAINITLLMNKLEN